MNTTVKMTESDIKKALNNEIFKLNNGITTTDEYFLNIVDIYRKHILIKGEK